jgi:S1-C subfamily serine protease
MVWLVAGLAACLMLTGLSARADLVATIARVKPSVVIVGVYQKTASPQFSLRGTGFVVGDGRTVATNAHVASGQIDPAKDGMARLTVLVGDAEGEGQLRGAKLLAVDKAHDLALLKIEGDALPALTLGDSGKVREGMSIAFMGFPIGGALGFSPVTHKGMISAITPIAHPGQHSSQLTAKVIRRIQDGAFDIFQLDATAYPGNSGGPLFDEERGEVLGIVNMVFVKGTKEAALSNPSGISYAIPSRYLDELLVRQSGSQKQ